MSLPRILLLPAACLSVTAAFAAPPPAPNPNIRELHVVGLYEGATNPPRGFRQHPVGHAAVRVDRPGKTVTLVLSSYEPVAWAITATAGTRISQVILGGYYRQTVDRLPREVEVTEAFQEGRQGGTPVGCAYKVDSAAFRTLIGQLHAMTGLELQSFHGAYRYDPRAPFVVDRTQNDPRLRSDYPRPEPAADLPKLEFQALHFVPGQLPFQVQSAHGRFTLTAGPDVISLRPLPNRINRLTANPATNTGYALSSHEVYAIDLNDHSLIRIKTGLNVPELSWPCGVAFDTKRQRLIVASLGGVGYLYAYTPKGGRWEVLADLGNVDLAALAYHPKEDALFGLSASRGGDGDEGPVLYRYNDKGALVSRTRLTGPVFPGLVTSLSSDAPAQLVAAGDNLVMLATFAPRDAPRVINPVSFIYLIDPKTGQARLGWKQ